MEDFNAIAFPVAVFVFLTIVVYACYVKISGMFRGFRGLKTKREIDKMLSRSAALRHLYESWKKASRRPGKAQLIQELMAAAKAGSVQRLKHVLDNRIDVESRRGPGGRSAVMRAAEYGHLEAVQLLLQRGARVNSKGGRRGRTALVRACAGGHLTVVRTLLEHRADVNASDARGMTGLMLAATGGHFELVNLLTTHGADPNGTDNEGKTALMHVVQQYTPVPFRAIIQLLAQKGADLNARDSKGRTVLDLATDADLGDLAVLLTSYGAKSGRGYEDETRPPVLTGLDRFYFQLDCQPTDSDEEVKRRYHTLVKDYHPDVIQGKGLPEDFVEYATHRFQEINEAFQQIMKERHASDR